MFKSFPGVAATLALAGAFGLVSLYHKQNTQPAAAPAKPYTPPTAALPVPLTVIERMNQDCANAPSPRCTHAFNIFAKILLLPASRDATADELYVQKQFECLYPLTDPTEFNKAIQDIRLNPELLRPVINAAQPNGLWGLATCKKLEMPLRRGASPR